jgi:hypothetical protein
MQMNWIHLLPSEYLFVRMDCLNHDCAIVGFLLNIVEQVRDKYQGVRIVDNLLVGMVHEQHKSEDLLAIEMVFVPVLYSETNEK